MSLGGIIRPMSIRRSIKDLAKAQLRTRLQAVVDEVINPGVAGHSGHIAVVRLRRNSVWVEMGGGCQGCSSAAVTLREGIVATFREHVPEVGAIYDDTDHAAGENPWFR